MSSVRSKNLNFLSKIPDKTKFIKSYLSLNDSCPSTYIFLKINDETFTTHGNSCQKIIKNYLKDHNPENVVSNVSGVPILPSVELSMINFKFLARKLLIEKGYKIKLYDISPGSKNPIGNNKNFFVNGGISGKADPILASPGNLRSLEEYIYEDGDFSSQDNTNRTICIILQKNLEVNLAYVDMHMREIKYVNFTDNHQLTRLESSLVQIGGKEIIYNQNENSGGTLKGLLRRLGVPFDSKDMNIIGKDNFGNLDYFLGWCGDLSKFFFFLFSSQWLIT